MNRIAIIADIHGNIPALEAVIADIERQGVDAVWVGGDLVGRGPQGNAVVHRILELGWPSIRGNHEDYLLGFVHKTVPKEWFELEVWAAVRWMADELDPDAVRAIKAFPFTLAPAVLHPFRIFHGSPNAHTEGVGVWTSDETCLKHLNTIEESTFVCGHTHRPHLRELPEGTIINVGSVGLPFNGDWRAQYAILQRDHKQSPWEVVFCQVPYEREELYRIYEDTGFLQEGHVTARLLKLEVETARPHLVPFLRWTSHQELDPSFDNLDSFLDWYDPTLPLAKLIEQIEGAQQDNQD